VKPEKTRRCDRNWMAGLIKNNSGGWKRKDGGPSIPTGREKEIKESI